MSRFLQFPTSGGKVPVKLFEAKKRTLEWEQRPIASFGMESCITSKLLQLHKDAESGIPPVSMLSCNARNSKPTRLPICSGMVPDISLESIHN
ncbi:hypothetical protein V6N13_077506 [Hibiscus sabdariffa]